MPISPLEGTNRRTRSTSNGTPTFGPVRIDGLHSSGCYLAERTRLIRSSPKQILHPHSIPLRRLTSPIDLPGVPRYPHSHP